MSTVEDQRIAERMTAYLDGQLEPEEAQEFEAYLQRTPAAQAELEELRTVMHWMAHLSRIEAPPDLYEKIARRLRKRQLLAAEAGPMLTLVSLPFHVISIVVILVVAALYMMAQLEQDRGGQLERDAPPTPEVDLPSSSPPAR